MKRNQKFMAMFPLASEYQSLTQTGRQMVRESNPPDQHYPITERHLQCVWYDQSLRPTCLTTDRGENVVVEHPGRWNLEAGPDFLDATLRIGKDMRLLKGDVEIHILPADWTAHGHKSDPAYARVIAHVTYTPGALSTIALPAGAVQVSMRDAIRAIPSFSFENLDVTAYPYAKLIDRRAPCASLIAHKPLADWMPMLESAGHERLRRKAERVELSISERGADQVFYEEVMTTLGYKHNKAPFRELASVAPLSTLDDACKRDATSAYATLLGIAGLLPGEISREAESGTRTFMRKIWDTWWKQSSAWEAVILPAGSWKLSSLRPQNHPVRRLAAAASIFTHTPRILTALKKVPAKSESWFKNAGAVLESYSDGMEYWRNHLTLGGKQQKAAVALLGQARISAILSNAVVPFLAASGTDVTTLLESLPPEEDNSIIRHTAYALFGRDHNPALYRRGILQQGLIQIFHDFCVNNHANCTNCALAESLQPDSLSLGHPNFGT